MLEPPMAHPQNVYKQTKIEIRDINRRFDTVAVIGSTLSQPVTILTGGLPTAGIFSTHLEGYRWVVRAFLHPSDSSGVPLLLLTA